MTIHTTLLRATTDLPAGAPVAVRLDRALGVQRFRAHALGALDLPPGTRLQLEPGLRAEVERRGFGRADSVVLRLVGRASRAALLRAA